MKIFTGKHIFIVILICFTINVVAYCIIQFRADKALTAATKHDQRRSELLDSIVMNMEVYGKSLDNFEKKINVFQQANYPELSLSQKNLLDSTPQPTSRTSTYTSYTYPTIRVVVKDTVTQEVDFRGLWSISLSYRFPKKNYHTTSLSKIYLFQPGRNCELYYPVADSAPIIKPTYVLSPQLLYGNWAMEKNNLTTKFSTNIPGRFVADTFKLYLTSNNILYTQKKVGKRMLYTVLERLPRGIIDHIMPYYFEQMVNTPKFINVKLLRGTWGICDADKLVLTNNCNSPWTEIKFEDSGKCTMLLKGVIAKIDGYYQINNNLLIINPGSGAFDINYPPLRLPLIFLDSNTLFAFRYLNKKSPFNYFRTDSNYYRKDSINRDVIAFKKSPYEWYSYIHRINNLTSNPDFGTKVNPSGVPATVNPKGSSISINPGASSLSIKPNAGSLKVATNDSTNKNKKDSTNKNP